jgi:hypothetical protein
VEIIEWRVTLQEQPITLLLPFELSPRVSCWCGATE